MSRISGLLSYSYTIKTIAEHLKPVLQEHRKVMSKKINTPAPAMLYFSAITKSTEPILELRRWKSIYQLLHINFLPLALITQDAILHLARYLSLIMQIVPLVSVIQNICRISLTKMYLHVFGCISAPSSFLLYSRWGWWRTLFLMQICITVVERTHQGQDLF